MGAAATPAVPRTGEREGFLGVLEEGLVLGEKLTLAVSLAVRLVFVGVGDLVLVVSSETLFPDGEATPVLGTWRGWTWRGIRGALVGPIGFLGVTVASFGVLRLGTGSLGVSPGVLRMGTGSFEAPPEMLRGGGGTGRLARPVAVAPLLAAPLPAVPPPEILLLGTGSLDFQACMVPVPKTCLMGGGAATPLCSGVPANLSAVERVREYLPGAQAEAVVFAMSFVVEVI